MQINNPELNKQINTYTKKLKIKSSLLQGFVIFTLCIVFFFVYLGEKNILSLLMFVGAIVLFIFYIFQEFRDVSKPNKIIRAKVNKITLTASASFHRNWINLTIIESFLINKDGTVSPIPNKNKTEYSMSDFLVDKVEENKEYYFVLTPNDGVFLTYDLVANKSAFNSLKSEISKNKKVTVIAVLIIMAFIALMPAVTYFRDRVKVEHDCCSEILDTEIIEWVPQADWSEKKVDDIKAPFSNKELSGISRTATITHNNYSFSDFPDVDYLKEQGWVEQLPTGAGGPFDKWSEYHKDGKTLIFYQENLDKADECPCKIKLDVFMGDSI